jgi:hypothetical protein
MCGASSSFFLNFLKQRLLRFDNLPRPFATILYDTSSISPHCRQQLSLECRH